MMNQQVHQRMDTEYSQQQRQQQHPQQQHQQQQQAQQQSAMQQQTKDHLKDTTHRITKAMQGLKSEIEERKKENRVLTAQLGEKTELCKTQTESIINLQMHNEQLSNRIDELQTKQKEISNEVSNSRRLTDHLKDRIHDLTTSVQKGEGLSATLIEITRVQDHALQNLQEESRNLRILQEQQLTQLRDQHAATVDEKNDKISALLQERATLLSEVKAQSENLSALQKSFQDERQATLETHAQQMEKLQAELTALQTASAEQSVRIQDLVREAHSLQLKDELNRTLLSQQEKQLEKNHKDAEDRMVTITRLQNSLDDLSKQVQAVNSEKDGLREKLAEETTAKQALAAACELKAQEARGQFQAQQEQLHKLEAELAATVARLQETVTDLQASATSNDTLSAQLADLEQQHDTDIAEFEKRIATALSEAQDEKQKKEIAETCLATTTKQLADLKAQLASEAQQFDESTSKLKEQHNQELTQLREEVAHIRHKLESVEAEKQLESALASESKRSTSLELDSVRTSLREAQDRATSERTQLQEKITDLQRQLFNAQEEIKRKEFDLSMERDRSTSGSSTLLEQIRQLEDSLAQARKQTEQQQKESAQQLEKMASKNLQELSLALHKANLENHKAIESRDKTIADQEAEKVRLQAQIDTLNKELRELAHKKDTERDEFKAPRKIHQQAEPSVPQTPKIQAKARSKTGEETPKTSAYSKQRYSTVAEKVDDNSQGTEPEREKPAPKTPKRKAAAQDDEFTAPSPRDGKRKDSFVSPKPRKADSRTELASPTVGFKTPAKDSSKLAKSMTSTLLTSSTLSQFDFQEENHRHAKQRAPPQQPAAKRTTNAAQSWDNMFGFESDSTM